MLKDTIIKSNTSHSSSAATPDLPATSDKHEQKKNRVLEHFPTLLIHETAVDRSDKKRERHCDTQSPPLKKVTLVGGGASVIVVVTVGHTSPWAAVHNDKSTAIRGMPRNAACDSIRLDEVGNEIDQFYVSFFYSSSSGARLF